MTELNKNKNEILKTFILIFGIIIFTLVILYLMDYYNIIPKEYYKASDFNIKTIYSKIDFDNDNIDDYSDIVLGARKDAKNHPIYKSEYYEGGYPPDDIGVCTDVIWRAFKNAGYSLKDMVTNDIQNNLEDYPDITKPDSNIDFRRVRNLHIFFSKYAQEYTLDYSKIEQWQPGDIVIFGNDKHIGIISDRRNEEGIPYVIHNAGQLNREEDYLTKSTITAHYRFDSSLISDDILVRWQE